MTAPSIALPASSVILPLTVPVVGELTCALAMGAKHVNTSATQQLITNAAAPNRIISFFTVVPPGRACRFPGARQICLSIITQYGPIGDRVGGSGLREGPQPKQAAIANPTCYILCLVARIR